MIEGYFRHIEELLSASRSILSWSITYDKRSSYVGFFRGEVRFVDRSVLYLREFVHARHSPERYTYAYHYQAPDGVLIFRYDNAPHFSGLQTAPHHRHGTGQAVESSEAPGLASMLEEIDHLIVRSQP